MQLSDYEAKAINKFGQSVFDDKWSNAGLVALLKVIAEDFLQAKRVSRFAKDNDLSPQGARKFRDTFTIDGYQFIADNE